MEIATKWQEGLARRGRDTKLGEDLALVLQIHMADTEEEAMAEATPWSQEQFKVLAPLGRMPTLTQEQILSTYDGKKALEAGLPTVADRVRDGGWICGPADHVYEKICEIQDRFPGLERITIHAGALAIPPSAMRRDLEWFGREVLPRFTQVK